MEIIELIKKDCPSANVLTLATFHTRIIDELYDIEKISDKVITCS